MAVADEILTLSLIQSDLVWENVAANLSNIEAMFRDLPADVDLVVLPEMFSTGFSMQVSAFAETMDGKAVEWMKNQASSLNAVVAGSLMIRVEKKFYNRFLFVKPGGEIQYYDKRHLFSIGEEDHHFTAGKERKIIQLKGFRILPQVCYDLRFPVFARNRSDYDLYLNCANWPASRQAVWECLLKARAIENQVYVAGVNRLGIDGNGIKHDGGSVVFDARGSVLAEASGFRQVLSAKLSLNLLHSFRRKFPVLPDADNFTINI